MITLESSQLPTTTLDYKEMDDPHLNIATLILARLRAFHLW